MRGLLVMIGAACAGMAAACTEGPRDISGSYRIVYVTESGEQQVPLDLSSFTIAATEPPSFDSTVSGSGYSDGTFSISDVPAGTAYVHIGSLTVVTAESELELAYDALGRTGTKSTSASTTIALSLDNLAPWQPDDELQMYVANTGMYGPNIEAEVPASAPGPGATALVSYPYRMTDASNRYAIDGGAGDRAIVTQLSTVPPGYKAVVRGAELPTFSTIDGSSVPVQATMMDSTPKTLDVTWERGSFTSAIDTVASGSTGTSSALYVHALAGAESHGYFDSSADLLVYSDTMTSPAPMSTSGWSFVDPLPVAWTRMVSAYTERLWTASSSAGSITLGVGMRSDNAYSSGSKSLTPTITPVQNVTFDDAPRSTQSTSLAYVPAIRWSAPAVGDIRFYLVIVYELQSSGSGASRKYITELRTNGTAVAVPPWMLRTGTDYVFQIRAIAKSGLPSGYSWFDSGVLRY